MKRKLAVDTMSHGNFIKQNEEMVEKGLPGTLSRGGFSFANWHIVTFAYYFWRMRTIILLLCSNIFMTFAWYGQLKHPGLPMWKAILISWGIAFFEYCLMVPANRWGFSNGFNGFQLKMTQEAITLVVFTGFALFYLNEPFHWRYLVSFGLLLAAVYVMFRK